ncbi:MAG TPA: 16S rRNA (cytosine(1402)-N(4))-methyltransferase RsmH [Oligoflexia bacterium]|nr:16S rRNA (cytosine(1402)-N(4))-methyltransferase RsmH [Oligoflexia bacterium]HMP48457.1 16S rRNA (cytosine(1402)-N(4))-methyltransferase RsmH [Oligoflexia bacterium]
MNDTGHVPVFVREVIEALAEISAVKNDSCWVVDCTLGLGGHSSELLSKFPNVKLVAIDKDESTRSVTDSRLSQMYPGRFYSYAGCFSSLSEISHQMRSNLDIKTGGFDGLFDFIFADLGISSVQLDNPERGLSFKFDGPLDMRMDQHEAGRTAHDIVNLSTERELRVVFLEGGVGSLSKPLAREIVARRPIDSTFQLRDICSDVAGRFYSRNKPKNDHKKNSHTHAATVPFQALRMAVNKEHSNLLRLLAASIKLVAPGGRICMISFHSLEDKFVTQAMRWWSSVRDRGLHAEDNPLGFLITRKAVSVKDDERLSNPRSRSARLRIFERGKVELWKEREFLPKSSSHWLSH